jgi:hypothetical protein
MNNSKCDNWCIAGLLAIVGSIVLGALISLVFTGFGLMFFGVVFVLGVITLGIGLVLRRVSPKAEAS